MSVGRIASAPSCEPRPPISIQTPQPVSCCSVPNANYQSVSYGDLARSAPFKIASYALVDLRAGIEGDKWTASLWGRNVFNKTYETSTGNIGDFITRYAGRPATYGVRLSYRY